MSTIPAFTFRLASGATVGPVAVHGFGGLAVEGPDAEKRVRLAIANASAYQDFAASARIVEPCPGHVNAYAQGRACDIVLVNLRGARLVAVSA